MYHSNRFVSEKTVIHVFISLLFITVKTMFKLILIFREILVK